MFGFLKKAFGSKTPKTEKKEWEIDIHINSLHNQGSREIDSIYTKAKEAFKIGRYQDVLNFLAEGFEVDIHYKPFYHLFLSTSEKLEYHSLSQNIKNLLREDQDPSNYFIIAQDLIELGLFRKALPFLEFLFEITEDDSVLNTELISAYNGSFQTYKAEQVLGSMENVKEYFWLEYQYFWTKLLLGKTDGLKKFLLNENGRSNISPQEKQALSYLEECLVRLESLKNSPEDHIRDWQYIQYGSVVLDYNGYVSTKLASELRGRWGMASIDKSHFIGIVGKLVAFIHTQNLELKTVISMPNRDSQIVGRILAGALDIPFEVLNEGNFEMHKALIVGADNRDFIGYENYFKDVKNEQILFTFNHDWLKMAEITPDVIGLMSHFCNHPWGQKIYYDSDDQKEVVIPPDDRLPLEIAEEILGKTTDKDDYLDDLLDFYKKHSKLLKLKDIHNSTRSKFVLDSGAGVEF